MTHLSFLKGRSPLLGWKHPREHILKRKILKKKEIEEKEMGFSLKIVYSHPLPLFLFIFDDFVKPRENLISEKEQNGIFGQKSKIFLDLG